MPEKLRVLSSSPLHHPHGVTRRDKSLLLSETIRTPVTGSANWYLCLRSLSLSLDPGRVKTLGIDPPSWVWEEGSEMLTPASLAQDAARGLVDAEG